MILLNQNLANGINIGGISALVLVLLFTFLAIKKFQSANKTIHRFMNTEYSTKLPSAISVLIFPILVLLVSFPIFLILGLANLGTDVMIKQVTIVYGPILGMVLGVATLVKGSLLAVKINRLHNS